MTRYLGMPPKKDQAASSPAMTSSSFWLEVGRSVPNANFSLGDSHIASVRHSMVGHSNIIVSVYLGVGFF